MREPKGRQGTVVGRVQEPRRRVSCFVRTALAAEARVAQLAALLSGKANHASSPNRLRNPITLLALVTATLAAALACSPTAALAASPVSLTVTKAGEGSGGVVSSEPMGIECGLTCEAQFEENEKVILSATVIAEGVKFEGWTGCEAEPSPAECEVTMSEAKAVTATFGALAKFPLTVSNVGTGTGTVQCEVEGSGTPETCAAEYFEGTKLILTATPEPGSEFTGWSGACTNASGPCELTMGEAESVTASFEPAAPPPSEFPLTVNTAGTGTGTVQCEVEGSGTPEPCAPEYAEGTKLILTATPEAGAEFTGWSEACTNPSGPCELTISEAEAVTATFEPTAPPPNEFKLTVTKAGTGVGTVTSSPAGIECGATCEAEFEEGAEVELTPAPEPGSSFAGWSGACSGTGVCKVTISEAESVTAEFAALPKFLLTVAKTGHGTVTSTSSAGIECGATCSAEFEAGIVTLEAQPEAGYEFAGWIGCKSAGEATCEVDVTAASEVTAVFLKAAKEGPTGHEGPAGSEGKAGKEGTAGKEGAAGATGPAGATGSAGEKGASGAPGAQGPAGAAGPAGARGPAGKVELVTCKKVKGKQHCTTKLVSGTVKFTSAGLAARATLSRHGKVYAAGTASRARGRMTLRLLPVRRLRPGRYTLTLVSGSGRNERISTESFTLN